MKATDTCTCSFHWKWWQITYILWERQLQTLLFSVCLFVFLIQLNILYCDVTCISLTQCPWHHWQSRAQHQDWDTVSNYLFENDKQYLNDKWDCWREHKEKQWSRWKTRILKRHILQIEPKAIYSNILLVLWLSHSSPHGVKQDEDDPRKKIKYVFMCF